MMRVTSKSSRIKHSIGNMLLNSGKFSGGGGVAINVVASEVKLKHPRHSGLFNLKMC